MSENINDNPDFAYYQQIYAACIGAILLTSLFRGLVITYTTISASTKLHNKVFKKMIESTLTFFETTPSGRIQNIFSRDVDEGEACQILRRCSAYQVHSLIPALLFITVDNYIPISVEGMVQNIFTCSFAIIFICSIIPWFGLPLIALGFLFFCVSRVFR